MAEVGWIFGPLKLPDAKKRLLNTGLHLPSSQMGKSALLSELARFAGAPGRSYENRAGKPKDGGDFVVTFL